jgi:hypothetical protein
VALDCEGSAESKLSDTESSAIAAETSISEMVDLESSDISEGETAPAAVVDVPGSEAPLEQPIETVEGEEAEGVDKTEEAEGEKVGDLRGLVSEESLLPEWDLFVQNTLHIILDHQMVGSYNAVANISSYSQVSSIQ